MRADGPLFRDIASAIADGVSIDWSAAEMGTSDPRHRLLLEQLRVLEAIQKVGRDSQAGAFADAETADPGPRRWAHLEIVEEIGRGANGVVYRAWDPQLARPVALKLVPASEGLESHGLDEGRLLARVRHPHVVTVFGAAHSDGWIGLWMELVQGQTLETELRESGPMPVAEALALGVDLCGALSAVHGAGLLHRDIKTQNVMRDDAGRVVLMDFGTGRDRQTTATELIGTPLYMAPEVFRGEPYQVESDLYSLGVLIYRLIARRYPIEAASLADVRDAHLAGRSVPLSLAAPHVPAAVGAIVDRALAPDPARRYDSAAAMESALWAALQDLVANDLRAAEPRSTTRRRVGILTVLVLAAAAFAIWHGSATPPPGPRGVLYLSSSGWLGVVADGRVTIAAVNPHEAYPIVVSAGGRLVSTAGGYERTGGLAFEQATPWLRPVQGTPPLPGRRCCWFDGASDGHSTLAVHRDVYGDDGTEVHRFGARWSGGTLALRPGPGAYSGIAVTADGTWWLSTADAGGGRLERWRHGRRLARTDGLPRLVALAADPADGTVWGIAEVEPLDRLTLVQFGADGRQLHTAVLAKPEASFLPRGAEFAAPGVP